MLNNTTLQLCPSLTILMACPSPGKRLLMKMQQTKEYHTNVGKHDNAISIEPHSLITPVNVPYLVLQDSTVIFL
jgi:hypothetical protein